MKEKRALTWACSEGLSCQNGNNSQDDEQRLGLHVWFSRRGGDRCRECWVEFVANTGLWNGGVLLVDGASMEKTAKLAIYNWANTS
jgi:hypothetical protein